MVKSVLKVPYAFKLLVKGLEAMSIMPKLIIS